MNLATLSIKRPTFIFSIILVVIIVGLICMQRMSVDLFPDVNYPYVVVTTQYSGAGPEELEKLVSKVLEDEIASISGLKNLYSISQDGVSTVFGEFTLSTDADDALQQVKDKVAQVRSKLPDDIEEPVIKKYDPADSPVMMMSLSGNLKDTDLYTLADEVVKNSLGQVPNVSSVEIIGGKKREIRVELDRNKLKEYESSVSMVSSRIGGNSQNIPVGKVSNSSKEINFRSMGEFKSLQEISNVIVSFYGSDVPVNIAKVGKVIDTNEEQKSLGYLNGKKALFLNVYKQSGANSVAVCDGLLKNLDKINAKLQDLNGAPKLVMVRDNSDPIRRNIKDVRNTIFEGIALTVVVVFLFLGSFKSTFITVVSLPNSLIGAFIFMALCGFSVNMLTLMALSLAVGLLIDDAIVVRENIFRHIEEGETPIVASQKGTDEVRLAVIGTTMTLIAVFLPVAFLQGMVGQFFKQFGLTIVFAVSISLFDALTTAPMLSAYMISNIHRQKGKFEKIFYLPVTIFNSFYKLIEKSYEKIMVFALNFKWLIILLSIIIFCGSLYLTKGVQKTFTPTSDFGEFSIALEAMPGTSLQQMEKYTMEIEQILRRQKEIQMVVTNIGNENSESNVSNLYVKLVPYKERACSTTEMKEHLRKLLSPYKKFLTIEANETSGPNGGQKPFSVILMSDNLEKLGEVSEVVVKKFSKINGLVDVVSDYRRGKPEYQIKMNPKKMELLGVQSTIAGNELRAMVEGTKPAKYRENGVEYDIRVRLQENQRDLSKIFNNLYIPNVNNQLVKLKDVAEIKYTTGPSKIKRRNRARYVEITANLGKGGAIGSATTDAQKILKDLNLPKNVSYVFSGSTEDMKDLFTSMIIAALLAIIFMYLVLASLYESLIIPFTIMSALPLAIIGGLLALWITHESLNIFSMIGFIMLLGLVAKNSILLVDYIQQLMQKGMAQKDAILQAGKIRLRPILMTTIAMIAGMMPLALGLSEVGRFRRSMGIAIIGGLISSTILTLVVIPSIFGFMDNFRRWSRKKCGRPEEIDLEL